jgi:YD repeat-containing protein
MNSRGRDRMRTDWKRSLMSRAAVAAWILSSLSVATTATAQIAQLDAPVYSAIDPNGVDLLSMSPYFRLADISIGAGASALVHTLRSGGLSFNQGYRHWDSFSGYLAIGPNVYINSTATPAVSITYDGGSELFYKSGTSYISLNQRGSTLVANSNGTYTYTTHDGTIMTIDPTYAALVYGGLGLVTRVAYPDGRVLTITPKLITVSPWTSSQPTVTLIRIQSVMRSDGLQIKYSYSINSTPTPQNYGSWVWPSSVTAINNAFEYCDPAADSCSLTGAWPTVNYAWSTPASGSGSILTATDMAGRVTRYTMNSYTWVTGVKLPSSASADNITYTYCGVTCTGFPSRLLQVVRDGQTWTYGFSQGSGFSFTTFGFTNPVGSGSGVQLAATFAPQTAFVSPLLRLTDEDGTVWASDPRSYTGQINSVTKAEGNYTTYAYDGRGNVAGETQVAKSGSGLANIQLSAGYDTTCLNPLTCNKANWVKDALQNETDYAYDPVHGGVLTITAPPVSGIRPQRRYAYTQRSAWVKNAAGSYVASANGIWVLTRESFCRTTAASGSGCAVASDEVVTTYEYGPDSGPNNLFLRGVAVTADGQILRTCYGYDSRGNKISQTLPRAGLSSCP